MRCVELWSFLREFVLAVLTKLQHLRRLAITLDANQYRAAGFVEHDHVIQEDRPSLEGLIRRLTLTLEHLAIDEVVSGVQLVAKQRRIVLP